MFFKKNKKNNLDSSTPDRYANLAIRVKNLQRVITSLLLIITLLITILGTITFKNNTKVYVIEKDANNYTFFGSVNDLTKITYNPDDNSLIYFVNSFVNKARFLPTDLVLYKKNQKELGYFLNSKAITKLDYILNQEDQYPELIKKEYVVDIEILSTLRYSPTSFQVRWLEKIFDKSGKLFLERPMVGLFKYEIKSPNTKEAIIANPIGLLITDLSISSEK
ncbi:type IV secretion system protein [Fusobacterium gastrosuis]|uniref:type IV secretion system protein n=1 Tax=Fusobacterium gastrosuis TaxID=1755100 RepID=UPI002A9DF7CF|nr:type IV secretion system protein [Fusobacterium gastrosuis]